MIRVAITGYPGSKHTQFGKRFADRLELPYKSAKLEGTKWCEDNAVNYYVFKNHYNADIDSYVNAQLSAFIASKKNTHMVVDSLQSLNIDKCVSVYIGHSILDNPLQAKADYEESLCEIKTMGTSDIYDETMYNVSFPSKYVKLETMVDTFVQNFIDGIMTGHYLHSYQLLPLYSAPISNTPSAKSDVVFDVVKYGFCYYLVNQSQYSNYLECVLKRKLVKVNFVKRQLQYSALPKMEFYKWLEDILPTDVTLRLELCHRLMRYYSYYGANDINQVYLDLSKNANPLRILRDSGF